MTKSHRLLFRSEWLFLNKCSLLFALLKCPVKVQHSIFMVVLCLWPFFLTYRLMLAALVVLIMIVISNFSALFFCCYATDHFGLWLKTYHRKDLACLRILVILHSIHHTPDGEKKSLKTHCVSCEKIQSMSLHMISSLCLPECVFRSRMVWLSTPHGLLLPPWSTSRWFSICGVYKGAQQQQPLCASCLEKWSDGKLKLLSLNHWS